MSNEISQSYGDWLIQNNKESAQLIRKTRQNTELRAAVGDFLDLFPDPAQARKTTTLTLTQLEEILKNPGDGKRR